MAYKMKDKAYFSSIPQLADASNSLVSMNLSRSSQGLGWLSKTDRVLLGTEK
jgi:hypothetical protein